MIKPINRLFLTVLFSWGTLAAFAAQVDTLSVWSPKMKKEIKTVVILPDNHSKLQAMPALYLLHGYSGNYGDWVNKVPHIKELVDRYKYMVVCPDGGFDSWYWDSENEPAYQYETFVSQELVKEIDQKYNTIKGREGRGITGLSMGGHGALSLAFKHQDVYGAAGSTSGGVDILPFPNNWSITKRIGSRSADPEAWRKRSVIEMTHLLIPGNLKLFIDCGYDDFFYPVNVKLHEKLQYLNIDHHFLTFPGKHDWNYWGQSLDFQMAFFNQFFGKK
ncbi:alpha/beta hydrolase [Sphingobacterium sp. SYP-B4668]|uniref:alpha/beta hydrolase n=1 Tax=Sphingobacterium sp. SYP-B4668 TaxID=2996035 RepID=UPI0022DE0E67|nr:alpha/beta hydrolase family protein [Sphingobacterium sp. SYP-B4668]